MIEDYQKNRIDGSFYENEMQLTKQKENIYLVEKKLKTRTYKGQKQYLVKWLGYSQPSWENVDDIDGDYNDQIF